MTSANTFFCIYVIIFALIQMTLHLCWNLAAQYLHHCRATLLLSPQFLALSPVGEGHPDAPTNARGRPAAGAKAKVRMRQKSVKRHLPNRRLFTRLPRWEHPRLCLWLESAAAPLFCLRRLKTGHECRKTRARRNKTEKHLLIKQMGWTALLPAPTHPA